MLLISLAFTVSDNKISKESIIEAAYIIDNTNTYTTIQELNAYTSSLERGVAYDKEIDSLMSNLSLLIDAYIVEDKKKAILITCTKEVCRLYTNLYLKENKNNIIFIDPPLYIARIGDYVPTIRAALLARGLVINKSNTCINEAELQIKLFRSLNL